MDGRHVVPVHDGPNTLRRVCGGQAGRGEGLVVSGYARVQLTMTVLRRPHDDDRLPRPPWHVAAADGLHGRAVDPPRVHTWACAAKRRRRVGMYTYTTTVGH